MSPSVYDEELRHFLSDSLDSFFRRFPTQFSIKLCNMFQKELFIQGDRKRKGKTPKWRSFLKSFQTKLALTAIDVLCYWNNPAKLIVLVLRNILHYRFIFWRLTKSHKKLSFVCETSSFSGTDLHSSSLLLFFVIWGTCFRTQVIWFCREMNGESSCEIMSSLRC